MLRKGVEAYGIKSLDAISPDFVNSFRSRNNNADTIPNRGVVTLNPPCLPFFASVDVAKNALVWKESIVIDHRGLLSSDPFTKGLDARRIGAETVAPLFVLREKIIALLCPASRGSRRSHPSRRSKTRKHLASRITFPD
jgi:hypothetical protein